MILSHVRDHITCGKLYHMQFVVQHLSVTVADRQQYLRISV